MEKLKLTLITAAVLGLAACSSGGNDSPKETSSTTTTTTTVETTKPAQPTQTETPSTTTTTVETTKPTTTTTTTTVETTKPTTTKTETTTTTTTVETTEPVEPAKPTQPAVEGKPVQGYAYFYTHSDYFKNEKQGTAINLQSDEISTVYIGEKTFRLIPIGQESKDYINQPYWEHSVNAFNNLQYGRDDLSASYFVQGKSTALADMPTTGEATYAGKAFGTGLSPENSDVKFNVDFANKFLSGAVVGYNEGKVAVYPVLARISGNQFESVKSENNTTETKGYFYGAQAQELGGIYYDKTKNVSGAYAAKKVAE